MRPLHPKLEAALKSGATTLCDCWRIERRDGLSLGFTDHDEAVSFEEMRFEPGAEASATETALGLSIGDAEVAGALTAEAVTEADLAAGLYDGAEVRRWRVDWRNPEARRLLFRGSLGAVERRGGAFAAQVEGLASKLNAPIGRAFLPLCDATLGDARCGAEVEAAFGEAREAGGAAFAVKLDAARDVGWFDGGRLFWTSGGNAGRVSRVRRLAEGRVELSTAAPRPVAAGDAFRLEPGCDRRLETCVAKFANALNFRGFPHMPGDGWLTAGPGSGGRG